MSRKIVDLSDFSRELGDFARSSLQKKREAVARGLARSIPDLVAASPVDTGMYAASWDFSVGEQSAIIGNHAPYAGIIEYGARPFTPPLAPLLAWAKRVLTNSRDPETGVKVATGQPESDYSPEVWALAKYTQKKISEEGMKPRHILENMIPTIIANIKKEFENLA
jgi:hypothetical protein